MIRQLVQLGGPLMWPLLLCSVLLTAVLIERTVVVGVRHRLLRRRLSSATLHWHRRVLPFFTDVPPSLGLLGTVVGVVRSFDLVNGQLSTEAMSVGLGIACMTTVFGLGIAIVASLSSYVLDFAVPSGAPEAAPC
jgi:biopolymer transport protein ExbB